MELLRRLFQGHLDVRYENEVIQVNVIGSDGANRPHRRQCLQPSTDDVVWRCGGDSIWL
jgi:hypothetical protein